MSTLEQVDYILTTVDIILAIIDISLIIYLFFYRFPPEKKKPVSRFAYYRKRHRRWHSKLGPR